MCAARVLAEWWCALGSGPHHNYISRASGRKCRASNTSFLQDSCLPILYRLEGILLKAHVSSMDVAEPTAGAKRNVETRCSRIAHGGILFLVLLTMPVLSAAACAIFEQRISTLCLALAACSANFRVRHRKNVELSCISGFDVEKT